MKTRIQAMKTEALYSFSGLTPGKNDVFNTFFSYNFTHIVQKKIEFLNSYNAVAI